MACLRLKRLLEEDPAEAIVVSHKRMCVDHGDASDQEVKTIFKFVGTVRSKDESVEAHLSKAISQENGAAVNRKRGNEYTVDTAKKCKVESTLSSKQSCFKLLRTVSEDETASAALETTVKGLCKLYDAEQYDTTACETESKNKEPEVITCNGTPLQHVDAASEQAEYVYDLYYSNVPDYPDEELLKDSIKIEYCALDYELQYDKFEEEDDVDEIDEDSNDEMNWRNDYPDEDEFEKDYEGYGRDGDKSISEQMASFGIGNGSYCSDSSGDEVDLDDERRFGRAYAKFRARIKARYEDEDDKDNGILNNAKREGPFAS